MTTGTHRCEALAGALTDIVGEHGIVRDAAGMEPYITEWRGLIRGHCDLVVRPATTDEVAAVMRHCHAAGIPVTPQGGNTGMVGGGVPAGGIVLATDRLTRIRTLDAEDATITVEAGCVLATAQAAAREAGFTFPLSLAAEGSCRVGGNLATNAGGNNTVRFGNTRENVLGIEVVLPDGRIWNGLRRLRKNNTGYDLKHLYIGSEGTLGIITAAVIRLVPAPAGRETVLAALPDVAAVARLFQRVRQAAGDHLLAFEIMPHAGLELAAEHVEGGASPFGEQHSQYALFEVGRPHGFAGLRAGLEAVLEKAFEEGLVTDAVLAESAMQAEALWRIREGIPEAQSRAGAVIKHDVSVPVSRIPEFIERGTRLLLDHVPDGRVVAFGHIGDGNIHFNLLQPPGAERDGFLAQMPAINHAVHDLVAELDGSFSAEHGIGSAKIEDMRRYRSLVELDLMRAVKSALDPAGIMNPGKVLPPD